MNVDDAVDALREVADPSRRPGMARVGIDVTNALGVSVPQIRRIANPRETGCVARSETAETREER